MIQLIVAHIMHEQHLRPIITEYHDPVEFLRDMIGYRKGSERSFSVMTASRSLRKISPALISLILKKKRKITLDRVEEISKLLKLNSTEKFYFKDWIERKEDRLSPDSKSDGKPLRTRKEVGSHLLTDWIHVYVKDCHEIPAVQANPARIYQKLSSVASRARIDRSIEFLLKEGHLRKTLEGRIVIDTPLTVATSKIPDRKIRQFHKSTLKMAKSALDLFPIEERYANALILPLNEKSYAELLDLIKDFAEKIQNFAETPKPAGERLYQFILNLSPTGGKFE